MGSKVSLPQLVYSQAVEPSSNEAESPVYRNADVISELISLPRSRDATLAEVYLKAAHNYSQELFLGSRVKGEDGTIGEYEWRTHGQVFERVQRLSFILASLGLQRNAYGLKCVGIFSKTREEWVVTDLACILQDITVVPIYDVYGEAEILKLIVENSLTTFACGLDKLYVLFKLKELGLASSITTLLCFDAISPYETDKARALNIQLLLYAVLTTSTCQGTFNLPRPESVYTVCYTSGVNGSAQGVKIQHRNVIAALAGVESGGFMFTTADRYMSYMPLSHMMERTFLHICCYFGIQIGFYAGDIRHLIEDMAKLKPTVFMSVPRIYMLIHDKIKQRYDELSAIKQAFVRKGLASKAKRYATTGAVTSNFWDKLVFNKTRTTVFGGRVRLLITGSASISNEIVQFLKIVFCCPFIEGYGQTEACAASFISNAVDTLSGHFGGPFPCVEFKLVDVPELNYTHKDVDSQGRLQPRGELCLRGPSVSSGYLDPELSMVDSDGWLHTGDICMRLPSNSGLKIIGRMRSIYKLAQGEFFSPEKLEAIYSRSPYISQILVYGDSFHSSLVAVVFPYEFYVRTSWQHSAHRPFPEVCRDHRLEMEIIAELALEARRTHLMGFEYVNKVALVPEGFPEHLLTPTQKLKRSNAYEYYGNLINSLY
jgi:long-chain acyl-CoA synthetase